MRAGATRRPPAGSGTWSARDASLSSTAYWAPTAAPPTTGPARNTWCTDGAAARPRWRQTYPRSGPRSRAWSATRPTRSTPPWSRGSRLHHPPGAGQPGGGGKADGSLRAAHPGHRRHRVPRQRQDDAAQPHAAPPLPRRRRGAGQRVRRRRPRSLSGRGDGREHRAAGERLPLLHDPGRPQGRDHRPQQPARAWRDSALPAAHRRDHGARGPGADPLHPQRRHGAEAPLPLGLGDHDGGRRERAPAAQAPPGIGQAGDGGGPDRADQARTLPTPIPWPGCARSSPVSTARPSRSRP